MTALPSHQEWLAALTPQRWDRANREVVAKLVTEFSFEGILNAEPDEQNPGTFHLALPPHGTLTYRARRRHLGHWRVDPGSLHWHPTTNGGASTGSGAGDPPVVPDAGELVAMAAPRLGLDATTAAGIVSELANTLVSDVWQLSQGRSATELAGAAQAEIEGEMRGHPWYVANKGRVGFDADDLARYSPEANQPVQLIWLAGCPTRADIQTVPGLTHATVVREQVGDEVWEDLRQGAGAAGLDPDSCAYIPVHPWQWRNRILALHASDLANRRLVPLGVQPGRYLPQQAIRTLADANDPSRRYLKLPLSILNTSVYRGLPRELALVAPALTNWFFSTVGADPFLMEQGLILLGEVASVSVSHRAMAAVPDVPYQHTEMLGAIWRESVAGHLRSGERAVTLAALLHMDPDGVPFLSPVIERSGLDVASWVDRLHQTVLPPLAHVLYRFGATFSPHGQNCLLVMSGNAPRRLVVKDFVDDAVIVDRSLPEHATMPTHVRSALDHGLAGSELVRWIQGGLLLCVYRYLSEVLEDHFGYPETCFWASARRALDHYHARFADDLAERFELFDLQAPTFPKLCLNRLRLFDRGYDDGAERPVISIHGQVENPLAPVRAVV